MTLAFAVHTHAANKPGPYPYVLPPQPNAFTPPYSTNVPTRADIAVTNLPVMRDWVVAGRWYPNVNTNSVKVSTKTGRISFQYGTGANRGTTSADINELPRPVIEAIISQLPYRKPTAK